MEFTKELMLNNCRLALLPESEKVTTLLPEFNKFIAEKNASGQVCLGGKYVK